MFNLILASSESWIGVANDIIALIVGLAGLVGTGIGTYVAIKATIEKNKGKSASEIWSLIMSMADKAMQSAEASMASGEDKKTMVMKAINEAAEAAGIDVSPFTSQLSAYIDQSIDFYNKMKKATE